MLSLHQFIIIYNPLEETLFVPYMLNFRNFYFFSKNCSCSLSNNLSYVYTYGNVDLLTVFIWHVFSILASDGDQKPSIVKTYKNQVIFSFSITQEMHKSLNLVPVSIEDIAQL